MPIDLSPKAIASASKGVDLEQTLANRQPAGQGHINPFFKIFPAAGQGADLATTLYALGAHGDKLQEGNSVLGNKAGIIGVKAGMGLIGSLMAHKLEKNHPGLAKFVGTTIGAAGAVPAVINMHTISKLHE